MRKIVSIGCLLLVGISSCRQKSKLNETGDHDLQVQLMLMESEPGDSSVVSYRVRLIPDRSYPQITYAQKTALLYRMDSCFYSLDHGRKTYPVLVQAVPNGVSGTFEYLLQFENDRKNDNGARMIYQDRYLNHKKYDLNLIQN